MKIRYRFSDRENKATNEQTGQAGVAFTPRFQVWSSRERQADHSIRKYDIWSFKRISVNKEWHCFAIGSAFNKCNPMTLEIKCTWDMNLRSTNSNLYFVSFHAIPCYLCNVICWCILWFMSNPIIPVDKLHTYKGTPFRLYLLTGSLQSRWAKQQDFQVFAPQMLGRS